MEITKKKINLAILFGGQSPEHEVSIQSAHGVVGAVRNDKYNVKLIYIDKSGVWRLAGKKDFCDCADGKIVLDELAERSYNKVTLASDGDLKNLLVNLTSLKKMCSIDVAFPVLHGSLGEDGAMQGLLKVTGVPFVGVDVLGSALGMDKNVTKRVFLEAGIPTARSILMRKQYANEFDFKKIKRMLGLPVFIKPASLGSSIGTGKAENENQFKKCIRDVFRYDKKVLIEEFIEGREIEVSVLGNDDPVASLPGEIVPSHDFYSYEAKYIDEDSASLEVPACLPKRTVAKIQDLAVKVFKVLDCEGMARVDFFLKKNGEILVNEINTIPGFTKISMYPKLWGVSGLSYEKLIDRLIKLAVERFEREGRLEKNY